MTDVIDAHTARRLIDRDPAMRVIDVRTGGEFRSAHIPGSFNIPLDTLSEHVDVLADLDHPAVLVCKSGARATKAHQHLTTAGKEHLHVLEGGIDAWESAGGEIRHGDATRWAMDRQVRLVAGAIALAALAASVAAPKAKWIAAGVAGGLTFSAVTNTCAMASVLSKLPYNRDVCDIDRVIDEIRREQNRCEEV